MGEISKMFEYTDEKNQASQKQAAWKFVNETSEALKLTRPAMKYHVSHEKCEYIASFCDGDGMITIRKNSATAVVALYQSSGNDAAPPVLIEIQRLLGGALLCGKMRKSKPEWRLLWQGAHCRPMLELMVKFGVVKKPQARIALDVLNKVEELGAGKVKPIAERKQIALLKKQTEALKISANQLTIPYVAGLFDAEGYVGFQASSNRWMLKIAQLTCSPLLHALQTYYNAGYVDPTGAVCWNAKPKQLEILSQIRPYLIVKAEQADLAITNLKKDQVRQKQKRREHQLLEDDEIEKKCKALKRYKSNAAVVNEDEQKT